MLRTQWITYIPEPELFKLHKWCILGLILNVREISSTGSRQLWQHVTLRSVVFVENVFSQLDVQASVFNWLPYILQLKNQRP